MSTEFLKGAMEKIYCHQYYDGFDYLKKAEFQAIEATHLATNFKSLLKSIQIKLISSTMIETAVDLEGKKLDKYLLLLNFKILGTLYFLPINWLPRRKKNNIANMLKNGMNEISEFAKKKSIFGNFTINSKKQDLIGEFKINIK